MTRKDLISWFTWKQSGTINLMYMHDMPWLLGPWSHGCLPSPPKLSWSLYKQHWLHQSKLQLPMSFLPETVHCLHGPLWGHQQTAQAKAPPKMDPSSQLHLLACSPSLMLARLVQGCSCVAGIYSAWTTYPSQDGAQWGTWLRRQPKLSLKRTFVR